MLSKDYIKIFVATPSMGRPYPDMIFSVIYQDVPENVEICFDMNSFVLGQPVHIARNTLFERFIKTDCTHLLWFDDDQVMDYNVISKLLESDKDIVSGIVPLRHGNDKDLDTLNIFYKNDRDEPVHYNDLSKVEEETIEIENCGTGCVMMKRECAEKIYMATQGYAFYFDRVPHVYNYKEERLVKYDYQDYNDNRQKTYISQDGKIRIEHIQISEDLTFFNKAKSMGYKLYANVTAICDHFEGRPNRRKAKTRFIPKEEECIQTNEDI